MSNGFVYVAYNHPEGRFRVERYRVTPDGQVSASSAHVVWKGTGFGLWHQGGALKFGYGTTCAASSSRGVNA